MSPRRNLCRRSLIEKLESRIQFTAPPTIGGVFVGGFEVHPYKTLQEPVSEIVVSFSESMMPSITNPANWRLEKDGANVTGDIGSISFGFNSAANRYEAILHLTTSYSDGNVQLTIKETLRDEEGERLDTDLDGNPGGGNVTIPFAVSAIGPRGNEWQVSPFTTLDQVNPEVAVDAAGDFVVIWSSNEALDDVYGQRYNAAGVAQGSRFDIAMPGFVVVSRPVVACAPDGTFVVAWCVDNRDGDDGGIYARRFDASGSPLAIDFRVNTYTTSHQSNPAIAMDSSGDFVIAWESIGQDGNSTGIYAQRYDAAGVAQGGEFRANTHTTNFQQNPSVAMSGSGDFVITWQSSVQDGSGSGIYAQRYDSAGAAQGGEFRVNSYTTGIQSDPSVAMDDPGNFVVVWESFGQDGHSSGIYGQRYDTAGAEQGGAFQLNMYTTSAQSNPIVRRASSGSFVAIWESQGQDGDSSGVFARHYDASGSAQGTEFRVNSYTTGVQWMPSIGVGEAGGFVAVWSTDDSFGVPSIFAQRFGVNPTPTLATLNAPPVPVTAGNPMALTATGASDDGSVHYVRFYRESNLLPGLQFGLDGDELLGVDTTESGGSWSMQVPTAPLVAGEHLFYAQAIDNAGLIGAPAQTTANVLAPAGPIVQNLQFLRNSSPHTVRIQFDRDVSGSFGLEDIEIRFLADNSIVIPNAPSFVGNVATLTFASLLADGNYRATITGSGITDSVSGQPMTQSPVFDFFMLRADANGDRRVDVHDMSILAANWLGSGKIFTQGDFNYDGVVNKIDLGMMATRWHSQLDAPPIPSPPVTTVARRTPVRTPTRTLDLLP